MRRSSIPSTPAASSSGRRPPSPGGGVARQAPHPPAVAAPPKAAGGAVGDGGLPFRVIVEGVEPRALSRWWRDLCQMDQSKAPQAFRDIYTNVRTFDGNTFHFKGGDAGATRDRLSHLLEIYGAAPSDVRVEAAA